MEQPNGVLLAANARTLPSSCHRSARSRRSAARLGWARRKPDSLFADRCYGHDVDRDQLCERGIVPAIARRGTWHGGGRLAPTGGRSGGPTVDPHHDRQLRRSEVGAPHVHHQALQPVAGLSCRRRQVWWSAAERGGVPDPVPAGHRHGRHRMGVSPPASPTDRPRQALLPQLECHGPPECGGRGSSTRTEGHDQARIGAGSLPVMRYRTAQARGLRYAFQDRQPVQPRTGSASTAHDRGPGTETGAERRPTPSTTC
ncbi:hypothetical protein SAMN02787118_11261 [Streptomyces mirabilis]|uniref:Transposase DDE domain-containing protein n=1 Tax=Streptomyces mirabilis TaxID=68239 RepID=A0A1I2LRJ1_9ACTN|nr:hypothetical protein SAMN02787118_11261 [Streptomyces mirabilis]